MLRFASPWLLVLAPAAIAVAWRMARRTARGDARLALPGAGLRLRLGRSPWQQLERGLPWLRAVALLLLVAAAARPQAGSRLETVTTQGVDIVLALDVSPSMMAEDFKPDNRLEVAKRTAERFVDGRASDRLGLVVFAELAATRCPLTLDHEMLRGFLQEVAFASPDQNATAIGMGLATAVNRLRKSDARSRVVVLLTDGENNAGQVDPLAAAEAARALGVKVHTVGVGTDGRVPIAGGFMITSIDEELLAEIARLTGGEYFRATDPRALEAVFATIDTLEKTAIESRERVLYTELFPWALVPALAVLACERLLAMTRLRRIP
jgi:Ca-activated chloride channel family protein